MPSNRSPPAQPHKSSWKQQQQQQKAENSFCCGAFDFSTLVDEENDQEFHFSNFSCCQRISLSMDGCFCYYPILGKITNVLSDPESYDEDEDTCIRPGCYLTMISDLFCLGGCLFHRHIRRGVIHRYRIQESSLETCMFSTLCPLFSAQQMLKEMTAHGEFPGAFCSDRPEDAPPRPLPDEMNEHVSYRQKSDAGKFLYQLSSGSPQNISNIKRLTMTDEEKRALEEKREEQREAEMRRELAESLQNKSSPAIVSHQNYNNDSHAFGNEDEGMYPAEHSQENMNHVMVMGQEVANGRHSPPTLSTNNRNVIKHKTSSPPMPHSTNEMK